MENKIMRVFFGNDCLPYKDYTRETHYPIVGNGYNGFNNTQKIRFYVDRIGGTLDTTWVATTKLPNGKILYELLSDVNYDSEIGEYYVQLSISNLYTQLKGDIFIGLSGYQGGVEVEEDEDTGIYTITGTPTIQATGVIKFTLNYAPQTLNNQSLGLSDLQQVLGYLSNFITQDTSVVVINNASVDVSGFEDGQMFYNTANNHFYKKVSGALVEQLNGYVPYSGATGDVNLGAHKVIANRGDFGNLIAQGNVIISTDGTYSTTYTFRVKGNATKYIADEDYVDNNIYEMASASVVLGDSDYAYLLKNNVRIHYGDLFYEKAKETTSQVIFYSVDYQRDSTGGKTTRTTKKITLTKSSQQLDAADIVDYSYNKAQADSTFAHSLDVSLNTTNYKLTITLKNNDNGGVLSTHTVDLPLESIVVSATYYDSYTYDGTTYTKVIVITLATTSVPTIIPVGDLVDDLATKTELTNGLALKVNKTDIVDNLTTNDATKVLSAKQGVVIQTQLNTKANDSAVVHNTGNETIDGVKTFQKEIKLDNKGYINYGNTWKVDIGTLVGNTENPMIRMTDSQVRIGGNLYPTADNSFNNGSPQIRWKTIYGFELSDGTNTMTPADYNELKAKVIMLEETLIDELSLTYTYLSNSPIPTNISGYPIIFDSSVGSDLKNIEGNSSVRNQLVDYNSFQSYDAQNIVVSKSGNIVSVVGKPTASVFTTIQDIFNVVANHKYLVFPYGTYNQLAASGSTTTIYSTGGTGNNFSLSKPTLYTYTTSETRKIRLAVYTDFEIDAYFSLQVFDLTAMGLDSVSTVDEAITELQKRGINTYEYNAYDEGSIVDSKATKLISKGFNIFDEQPILCGDINGTTGVISAGSTIFRTDKIYYPKNTTLYVKCPTDLSNGLRLYFYDKNDNYIGVSNWTKNTTVSVRNDADYFIAKFDSGYGTTYNHDICINVSTPSLNGTYKPYQAPTEYALTLPKMRSAGSVKDDLSKVRVGVVDLGSLDFYAGTNARFTSGDISDLIAKPSSGGVIANIICAKYVAGKWTDVYSNYSVEGIAVNTGGTICIRDVSKDGLTGDQFKTEMSGVYLLYELATPTDQTASTYPSVVACEKGGSLEVEYDNTDNTPSDFTFNYSVYKPIE